MLAVVNFSSVKSDNMMNVFAIIIDGTGSWGYIEFKLHQSSTVHQHTLFDVLGGLTTLVFNCFPP